MLYYIILTARGAAAAGGCVSGAQGVEAAMPGEGLSILRLVYASLV